MPAVRTVVLIPDSTRKARGEGAGSPSTGIADVLPKREAARLVELRGAIAKAMKLPSGPDLDPTSRARVERVPAYRRYQGNMYRHIPTEAWESRVEGVEVVIVSALYGFVLSREPIRAYGFSMAERVPGLGKLHAWWRERGLPSILASYVRTAKPDRVVDLLSLEYRKAVEGYRASLEVPVEAIDFPGLGRGSQPRRGELVAGILRATP